MANRLKTFLGRQFFSGGANLFSLDDPYEAMARLMQDRKVSNLIDAGASHGRVTQRLLRRFPDARAWAFEPQPMYREPLEKMAQQDSRVRPQFVALSDEAGAIDLHVASSPGITSFYEPSSRLKTMYPRESAEKEVVSVPMVKLDDWSAAQGIDAVEVMKFDIQGAEVRALRGAQKLLSTSTLMVYTEVLFNPLYEGGGLYTDIDQCLREHGFVLYNFYKPRTDERGMLLWANAIFLHAQRMGLN